MKKITVSQIKKVLKYNKNPIVKTKLHFGDNETDYLDIEINPNITFEDYAKMIIDMKDNVILDGKINEFSKEYSIGFYKIIYFTNIKIEDAEILFELINCTDIIELIDNTIGDLSNKIEKDYDFAISHWQNLIYNSSEWESVAISISNLIDNISQNMDKFKNTDINKVINTADKILNNKSEFSKEVIKQLDKKFID